MRIGRGLLPALMQFVSILHQPKMARVELNLNEGDIDIRQDICILTTV